MTRLLVTLALLTALDSTAWPLDVTNCGVVIPKGQTGDLRNDLVCNTGSCESDPAAACQSDSDCIASHCIINGVTLSRNARLNLNGFSLSTTSPLSSNGIHCTSNCDVEGGGGEISAFTTGVQHDRGKLTISSLTIHDTFYGLFSGDPADTSDKVVVVDVTVHHTTSGLFTYGSLAATNVTAHDNGGGILADHHLRMSNVTVTDNSLGADCEKGVHGTGIVAMRNFKGVQAQHLDLSNVTANDNTYALIGFTIRLHNSTLSGSQVADLFSDRRPMLFKSTCEKSRRNTFAVETWGVCTND